MRNMKRFNFILLFFLFFLHTLDNYIREVQWNRGMMVFLKNAFLAGMVLLFLMELYCFSGKRTIKSVFTDELKSIIWLTITFAVLSVYEMLKNQGFETATIKGLIRLLIPVFTAFVILNVMEFDDIYRVMAISLCFMFAGYVAAHVGDLSIGNFCSVSFVDSYSPFESNFFSPAAMGFCLFFCYFRKNKLFTFLSVLFTILTFKRIMVLYAVVLLLFGGMVSKWKEMPKWLLRMLGVIIFIFSILYIQLMLGNVAKLLFKYFGIEINRTVIDIFSMGRSWFIQLVLEGDFRSVGFMSSTVGFKNMEMDLPMIYIEMGILSVAATIYFMLRLVKNNWYVFGIIGFCLLELLTSHWFDITYFWIVAYVTVGCIQYRQPEPDMESKTPGNLRQIIKRFVNSWRIKT